MQFHAPSTYTMLPGIETGFTTQRCPELQATDTSSHMFPLLYRLGVPPVRDVMRNYPNRIELASLCCSLSYTVSTCKLTAGVNHEVRRPLTDLSGVSGSRDTHRN